MKMTRTIDALTINSPGRSQNNPISVSGAEK
jgi:hypothetical protein